MSPWIKIDQVENYSGPLQVYEYEGDPIAVFKLEDGYYAIDNICSHEHAFLSEGEIEDSEIECPLHGAIFDIKTGKNLTLPAVLPVKSYPVKVENGVIYLQVDE